MFIFDRTEITFGVDLPIQVLDDLIFANFNNYFEGYSKWRLTAIILYGIFHEN